MTCHTATFSLLELRLSRYNEYTPPKNYNGFCALNYFPRYGLVTSDANSSDALLLPLKNFVLLKLQKAIRYTKIVIYPIKMMLLRRVMIRLGIMPSRSMSQV